MIYSILLVDDDPVTVMMLNNYLKSDFQDVQSDKGLFYDINVVFANDGEDALEKLLLNQIDLIVTDINMPNMDGIELASIVKDSDKLSDIPIIFMTADEDKKEISYDMDIVDFLHKPINKKELIKKIHRIVQISEDRRLQEIIHQKELQKQKDEMMILFTHELKTPLNAIINFSSYINRNLQKPITPKRIEKFIDLSDLIRKNGTKLLNEINGLLSISKIKNNKMTYHVVKFNLSQTVNEIISNYIDLYNKEVRSEINEIEINGDVTVLGHIVENLYSNALKYSRSKIFMKLEKSNGKFLFSVEDDGFGIKKENRKKIFEMFEQEDDNILTREKEGTGIGLYLIKLLCDKFNYDIKVEDSDSLGGAKFILTGALDG